jgi:hypothetical protein
MPRSRCPRRVFLSKTSACFQVPFGGFCLAQMHLRVTQIKQRLPMLPLRRELRLEFVARVPIPQLFPIEISKTKVGIRLGSGRFHRGLELRGGKFDLVPCIEHFAHEHVNRGGIRVLTQQETKFLKCLRVLPGPEIALRQAETEFQVIGLRPGGNFQLFCREVIS